MQFQKYELLPKLDIQLVVEWVSRWDEMRFDRCLDISFSQKNTSSEVSQSRIDGILVCFEGFIKRNLSSPVKTSIFKDILRIIEMTPGR